MSSYKGLLVVKGDGRGKKIGVPTINIDPASVLDLAHGIYVCKVALLGKDYWGVMHFGPRPTFGQNEITLETYLFDFGPEVSVPEILDLEVFDYIRPVKRFKNAQLMVAEIDHDVAVAKKKIQALSS